MALGGATRAASFCSPGPCAVGSLEDVRGDARDAPRVPRTTGLISL